MSINSKQQVKCPSCGEVSEVTVWQSITAQDSPDLKDDLLKGKINMFRCPQCTYGALFPAPLLYTDGDKKLVISFSPTNDEAEKLRVYEEIKSASKASGELDALDGYNLRFVTQYNDLLEKILIFENNLQDKVLEVIKLLVLMQEPDKMEYRTAIFGKLDSDELEFLVRDTKEDMVYTSRVPMSTYETVSLQLRQSGVKFKSFDWEIVDSVYASHLLYGANNPL